MIWLVCVWSVERIQSDIGEEDKNRNCATIFKTKSFEIEFDLFDKRDTHTADIRNDKNKITIKNEIHIDFFFGNYYHIDILFVLSQIA